MTENKDMKFEEMLKRLEEIVRALDSVDTPLEESLRLFEEGASLVRACTQTLDEAQQKVSILSLKDGAVTESEFRPMNG